jgi:two-component system chemotaxis response regulator CheY
MSGPAAVDGRTILVVDDDPLIRRLIATTLEDISGFDLVEAEDGVDALERARDRAPAIVFLDIDMPRMDGITACGKLREIPGTSSSTIVILTAATDDRAEARAGAAGADLFLTKPFSPLDLLRLVDRIGRRGGD